MPKNHRVLDYDEIEFYQEIKKVTGDISWPRVKSFVLNVPDVFRKDFINMLIVGFEIDSAFQTLKETYNF